MQHIYSQIKLLLFRPSTFFKESPYLQNTGLLYGAFYLLGIHTVIEKLSDRIRKYEMAGEIPQVLFDVTKTWSMYWLILLVGGFLVALLTWSVGIWISRLFVKWCGEDDPSYEKLRVITGFSGLIIAIPNVIYSLFKTLAHSNYYDAPNTFGIFFWISVLFFLALPFWQTFVNYKGIITMFDVKIVRTRVLFLILPYIMYSAGVVAFVYLSV